MSRSPHPEEAVFACAESGNIEGCDDLGDAPLHALVRHRATARDGKGTMECALRLVAGKAGRMNRLGFTPLSLFDTTPPCSDADLEPQLRHLQ
eukprot:gene11033-4783_t